MIWIRADANGEIGSGHVMRCLSIAQALKRRGEQVCFLLADEEPVPLLEARGQTYRVLHTDYTRMEDELPLLTELLSEEKPQFFLADSYFVTAEYFRKIREHVPAGYVDDRCIAGLPVDVLINYNIFAVEALYGAVQADTKLLLGTEYVPLREEFAGVEYPVREKAEQVLLTTGGSDKYNLAGGLLEKLLSNQETAGLHYLVVSGAYNVHLPELRKIEDRHENVRICCNVSDMSRLMRESDIAVSAGGSTMYELSAVGVPILCFSFADNQERIVEGFAEKGLVCFGGNYLKQGEAVLEGIAEALAGLAADAKLRRSYSERQKLLVDGQGAMRIADEIMRVKKSGA